MSLLVAMGCKCLCSQPTIPRQIEMLNIFVGFEQSNRYIISQLQFLSALNPDETDLRSLANEQDETLGYIAEEPRGLLSIFSRQLFRTHRPFRAVVMDAAGSPVLWVWLILFPIFNGTQ